jgi:hypothetical protein
VKGQHLTYSVSAGAPSNTALTETSDGNARTNIYWGLHGGQSQYCVWQDGSGGILASWANLGSRGHVSRQSSRP